MATEKAVVETEAEKVVPFRPLALFDEMDRMFDDLFRRRWLRPLGLEGALGRVSLPQVDIIDQDDAIVVRAAVPGVRKEDLEISATDHSVTIRGRTHHEKEEKGGEYYRREISTGEFLRTIPLPAAVDDSKAKAVFRDGLLELTLPKLESEKRHTIPIEEG